VNLDFRIVLVLSSGTQRNEILNLASVQFFGRRSLSTEACILLEGAGEHLLTVVEVAAMLGVSRSTVYSLVASGTLPSLRVSNAIRVRLAELALFTRAHLITASAGEDV